MFTFCANAQDNFSKKFILVDTFSVSVPNGFYSSYFFDLIKLERIYEEEYIYDFDSVVKKIKAIDKLPVDNFFVKIFCVNNRATEEECIEFLDGQNAFLIGYQGISLLRQQKREKFPINGWVSSLYKIHKNKEISEQFIIPSAYKDDLGRLNIDFSLWGFGLGGNKNSPDYILGFFSQ